MMYSRQKKRISASPAVFLYLSLLLLILPLRWILGFVFAALIHEMGHLCALKLFGIKINRIHVDVLGAVIETGPMNTLEELISALAGPFAGVITVFSASVFPELVLCAMVQTAYNLIPLYPSDGGRALQCLLCTLLQQEQADKIMNVISYLLLAGIIGISIAIFRFSLIGVVPLALIWLKCVHKKNSLQR